MKQSRLHLLGSALLVLAALPWLLLFVVYLIAWALGCVTPNADDCSIGGGWAGEIMSALVLFYWLFMLSLPLAIIGMITVAIANLRQRKQHSDGD